MPAPERSSFFFVLEDPIRILFVDDDPILREFAVVHLSTEQASVEVRGDGDEAIQAIAEADYDIVLLDLEMPRMDGFEVLARLRADERTRNLPVIVVTGREDIQAIDRAYQAGATSFLIKPINWRMLSYQIRYVQRAGRSDGSEAEANEGGRLEARLLRQVAADAAELLRVAVPCENDAISTAARRFADRINTSLAAVAAPQG